MRRSFRALGHMPAGQSGLEIGLGIHRFRQPQPRLPSHHAIGKCRNALRHLRSRRSLWPNSGAAIPIRGNCGNVIRVLQGSNSRCEFATVSLNARGSAPACWYRRSGLRRLGRRGIGARLFGRWRPGSRRSRRRCPGLRRCRRGGMNDHNPRRGRRRPLCRRYLWRRHLCRGHRGGGGRLRAGRAETVDQSSDVQPPADHEGRAENAETENERAEIHERQPPDEIRQGIAAGAGGSVKPSIATPCFLLGFD